MKIIVINTPNGQYQIELERVAEDRAEHYSGKEGFSRHSMEWAEEVDYVMDNDYEGIDWLINNSDWEDWEPIVQKFSDEVNTTDEYFWDTSNNFEIKTV